MSWIILALVIICLVVIKIPSRVTRSIKVASWKKEVFNQLKDFQTWQKWSPWLCQEPDAHVEIHGDENSIWAWYAWKGKRIGAGSMAHVEQVPDEYLKMKINFLKPMKSTCYTEFHLSSEWDNDTKVTWTLDSKFPLFLAWMIPMMKFFIGMDYERWLKMFKELTETGNIVSSVEVHEEIRKSKPTKYVGIKTTSSIEEVPGKMTENFTALMWSKVRSKWVPFAIYHEWSPQKNTTTYTCAVPIDEDPVWDDACFEVGTFPEVEYIPVTHTGSYEHLWNAWTAWMAEMRRLKRRWNKDIMGWEVYVTDPQETKPKNLITEVNVALR